MRLGHAARLGAPDACVGDAPMDGYKDPEEIAAALGANGYGMCADRAEAVRVAGADSTLPKYKRHGTERIARIFSATESAPCSTGGCHAGAAALARSRTPSSRGASQGPLAGGPLAQYGGPSGRDGQLGNMYRREQGPVPLPPLSTPATGAPTSQKSATGASMVGGRTTLGILHA